MKNFFKKVAFVLALAMILTNIGPAAKTSAAEAPGLKYTSKVIYVGGSAFGDYTDNCYTPSKNTDGYKVTYEVTTGKDLITVASNGKITATGDGIGKAVVKVTYSPVNGDKPITANFTVKVRRNATDVRLTNATIAKIEEALKAGDEITLVAAKSFVGNSYKTGNYGLDNYMKLVSDQIAYVSSDEDVIKVEDNKLMAVGNGTATLTVYAYEYLDKTQTPVVYKDYTVTVQGGIQDVKQTTATKVAVTFAQEMPDVKASDFTITQVATKRNIDVKGISLSSDKKVITIETFASMNNGAEYAVTYDEKDYLFTATDNKVADIINNVSTIQYNTETKISANLVDKNGVVLDTITNAATRSDVTFVVDTNEGYMTGEKLVLFAVGNTANLKVTYRTGEYDSSGNEIGTIEREFVIHAVEDIIVTGTLSSTVTNDANPIDWGYNTENKNISVGETKYLHAYKKDSNDADVTKNSLYTFESADINLLIIGSQGQSTGKGIYGEITALKTGTAYILVKNSDGKTVDVISVNIRAKREYATFDLGFVSTTLSNSAALDDQNKELEIKFKDQFGDELNHEAQEYTITWVNGPSGASDISDESIGSIGTTKTIAPAGGSNKITFDAKSAVNGTYTYKITKGNVSKSLVIVVQVPNTSSPVSYKVATNDASFDLAVNYDWAGWAQMEKTIKVGKYYGGVLESYLNDIDNVVVRRNGVDVTSKPYVKSVSGSAITIAVRTTTLDDWGNLNNPLYKGVTKEIDTGSYTVTFTANGTASYSAGFVVTDTQNPVVARVDKTTLSASVDSVSDVESMILKAITFIYNGREIADADIDVVKINSAMSEWNGSAYNAPVSGNVPVTSVVVKTRIDGDWYVTFTVTVNKTFTIGS